MQQQAIHQTGLQMQIYVSLYFMHRFFLQLFHGEKSRRKVDMPEICFSSNLFLGCLPTTNRRRHLVMVNDGCITMMKLLIPLHLAPAFLLDLKRMLLQKLALMMVKRHKRLKGNSSSNNSNCFVSW
jgi:hypothetical protein